MEAAHRPSASSLAVGNGSVWVDWNSSGGMVARGAPVGAERAHLDEGLGAPVPAHSQELALGVIDGRVEPPESPDGRAKHAGRLRW